MGFIKADRRRHHQLLPGAHDVPQGGALVLKHLTHGGAKVLGLLDANALDSHGFSHSGEVRILEIATAVSKAACLHFQLNESESGEGRADIARKDRIVLGELARNLGHIRRMDELAVGATFSQGIETRAGLVVIVESIAQMRGIRVFLDERH